MKHEKAPKVSVIIPTFRRPDLLKRAIKSVLEQTFQDFEIIVVDDNNPGEIEIQTHEIVRDFNDERLRYVPHEINKGNAAARNTGINLAKGEYVAFLDDDDIFLPQKLKEHINILDESTEDVVLTYSQHYGLDTGNNYRVISPTKNERKSGYIYEYMLRNYFEKTRYPSILFQTWDALIKKQFIQDMRFDEGGVDGFLLRLARRGKFIFVAKVLHVQYLEGERLSSPTTSPGNLSGNRPSDMIYKQHSKYIAEHGIKFDPSYKIAMHSLVIGTRFIRKGNIAEGKKMIFHALRVKPSLYSLLVFLLSFTGKSFFVKALKIRQKVRGGLA
ncbi:MAG: glycosyltransferase family 2 protein [Dehalococcoidia bacterium]|nr:glycosyltransferase family 2 protein [Dehalococcoidia bacterium]